VSISPRIRVALAAVLLGSAPLAQAQDFLRNLLRAIPGQSAPAPQAAPQPSMLRETSEQEEIQIGRQLAGNLLGAAPLVKDEALQGYVNRVGRWVASQSERPELKWYFGVLDTDSVNAFALPGGYVFITRGLLRALANEAELAAVLGHEIGHVVMKHHLKILRQSQGVDFASSLIGSQVGGGGLQGVAVQQMLGKGAEALARGLDKDAEYEADRLGVVLATRAGYDPYAMAGVLQKLGRANPREPSLALLFKTHPLPQERLEKLGDAMRDSFDRYADGKSLAERFARVARP
jgi:predicted Zn-dependent protease